MLVMNGLDQLTPTEATTKAGFRFGDRGTHTSRTMMLAELTDLLAAVQPDADRDAYAVAIVEENVLGKATASTRRLTNQRLGELYGLDPRLPLFRVLRKLWAVDEPGRPLFALLSSLARDPTLALNRGACPRVADGRRAHANALLGRDQECGGRPPQRGGARQGRAQRRQLLVAVWASRGAGAEDSKARDGNRGAARNGVVDGLP